MKKYFLIGCAAFLVGWLANGWRLGEDIALIEKEHAQAIADAQSEARAKEAKLSEINENLQKELRNEKAESEKHINKLLSDIRTSKLRLSVPVSGCSEGSSAQPGKTRAELDRTTAESLIQIANDGDNAIRDLNYCIDAYNSIKNN